MSDQPDHDRTWADKSEAEVLLDIDRLLNSLPSQEMAATAFISPEAAVELARWIADPYLRLTALYNLGVRGAALR